MLLCHIINVVWQLHIFTGILPIISTLPDNVSWISVKTLNGFCHPGDFKSGGK
jgi:hypothetical protein